MIPRIIHQTWKTSSIPDRFTGMAASWQRFNPGWKYRLWTDRDLLEFVAEFHPQHLELFTSYRAPVSRADAARYMLLQTFGGVYADIDAECVSSLVPLESEDRVVLCEEPRSHWPAYAPQRGHDRILFNGVMAGPAGHPFWHEVTARLHETRHAYDTLDRTGPCFLTGVWTFYPQREQVRVDRCRLFTPSDKNGNEQPPAADEATLTLAKHEWAGSWFSAARRKPLERLHTTRHRLMAAITRGQVSDEQKVLASLNRSELEKLIPAGKNLSVLIPVRDAAEELEPLIAALLKTDVEPERTRLVFCEGDSRDGTWDRLQTMAPELKRIFRDVLLARCETGIRTERAQRWQRKRQRSRRVGLARARNHLIDVGVKPDTDWVLWLDADVFGLPSNLMAQLFSANARIVVPNCVRWPSGPTYDLNTFVETGHVSERLRYKYLRDGIFQPPARSGFRLIPDELRHSERVEVDGVGGTVLLVDANVHRAGIRFPELPYRNLIETQGFGVIAGDAGVRPVLLPRLEVMHVPW